MVLSWTVRSHCDRLGWDGVGRGGQLVQLQQRDVQKYLHLGICDFKPKSVEVVFLRKREVSFLFCGSQRDFVLSLISTSYNKMVPKSYKSLWNSVYKAYFMVE